MSKRKTFDVETFKHMMNARIAHVYQTGQAVYSPAYTRQETLCSTLESVLMDSGNYKGYKYVKGLPNPDEPTYYYRKYY